MQVLEVSCRVLEVPGQEKSPNSRQCAAAVGVPTSGAPMRHLHEALPVPSRFRCRPEDAGEVQYLPWKAADATWSSVKGAERAAQSKDRAAAGLTN